MDTTTDHEIEDMERDEQGLDEDIPDPEFDDADDDTPAETLDEMLAREAGEAQDALDAAAAGPPEVPAEPAPEGPAQDQTAAAAIEPPRRFTRQLVCKMYPEELARKAVALAAALTAHEVRENQIKEDAKAGREELTAMWEDVKKLSRIVTAGGEEREVECELVRNDREGSIETVRLDTGEVIDRRAQDAEERQLPLRPLDRDVTDAGPEKGTEAPEGVDGDQCAVIVDGERCEGRAAAGQVYCPECIADAEAKRDEQEAAAAAARPRCAVGDCEEEAGASGYCGQHDRTEASTSPATPKAKRGKKARG